MSGPLEGIRVLELASFYAAPLIATFLADQGADVAKVEPPAGDPYRAWPEMWALVGRGKRSLALEVDSVAGAEIVRRLVPHMDVVVENLAPRVAERHGLTPEALRAVNPALVVVSATGFGRSGPYADRPANGTLGEALAGLTDLTGDAHGPPMQSSVPLGDAVAAAFGAFGAAAAVVRALRSGEGAHVELTVHEPILHVLGTALTGYRAGGPAPTRGGGEAFLLRGAFGTLDGRWVAISCSSARHVAAVADLVGADTDEPLGDRARGWIASRAQCDVLDALVRARVPVAPVHGVAEMVKDEHVLARGSIMRLGEVMVAAPTPRIVEPEPPRLPVLGDANLHLLGDLLGIDVDVSGQVGGSGPDAPP